MLITWVLLILGVVRGLKIIVDSDYYPLSKCNAENNTNFTGYEFEIIVGGLKRMGMKEGSDYTLTCSYTGTPTFDDFLNSILTQNDTVLIAGITITSDRIKAGA